MAGPAALGGKGEARRKPRLWDVEDRGWLGLGAGDVAKQTGKPDNALLRRLAQRR